jgi:hypothetical protein
MNSSANANMNANAKSSSGASKLPNAKGSATTNSNSSATDPKDFIGKLKKFVKENKFLVIFIAVVFVIFILVIVYIRYAMKTGGVNMVTLNDVPVKLNGTNSPLTILNKKIPTPVLGRQYGFAFWVYLENYSQTPGTQKMLWYRGQESDISSANPIVYMDDVSNKMYFVIKTENSVLSSGSIPYNQDIGKVKENNFFLNDNLAITDESNKHLIVTLDYVPLQRWAHVALIIDNKVISVYLDGEIYSVRTVDDYKSMKEVDKYEINNKVNYNLIVDKSDGNIYVGKNPSNSSNITINGYMSKFDAFNFAPSAMDIRQVYSTGPFSKNVMAMLGLGSSYGVRSPIYKIAGSIE